MYKIDRTKLPRGFGKRGGIYCPVCRQEAYSTGYSAELNTRIWFHEGRKFNCKMVMNAGPVADATNQPEGD